MARKVIDIIYNFVRKRMTLKGDGRGITTGNITSMPTSAQVERGMQEVFRALRSADINPVLADEIIKNEKDLSNLLNRMTQTNNQRMAREGLTDQPRSLKDSPKKTETDAEIIARMNKENKETVARLKKKKEKDLKEFKRKEDLYEDFSTKKQPNPFDKASELKEGEQIEMDFTDWDPKGMAGGGLARALFKLKKKFGKDVVQKGKAPKKSEKKKLQDMFREFNRKNKAGGGLAYMLGEDDRIGFRDGGFDYESAAAFDTVGDMGMTSSPSRDTGSDYGQFDRAAAQTMNNPAPSSGRDNIQSIMNNPFVKAASFAVNPMGTMMGLGARNLYDQYMLDKALTADQTADYGYPSKVKQNVPRENEGNDFTPWWLKQQAPSSLGMAAMKPKDDFDLYGVVEGRTPSRFYADGGRIEFDKGGFNKGRRNFMKLMAGVASLPFVGKFFKAAKPAAKAVKAVEASNAAGMPAWFPKLVDKVMKEGKDLGGTVERQIVKEVELPSGTKVIVDHDLTTGNTIVDVGMGKHGFDSGRHGQPARLELKKGEWIEPPLVKDGKVAGTQKGVKTQDEFYVEEAEFTGGHPENIKFEESSFEKYGDHASDFSEVEYYATGKNVDKFNLKGTRKAEADDFAQGRAEMEAEQIDEFAKGGIAHMLGE